jgi:hypothetical protein
MNWTILKIVALVIATSVLTSISTGYLMMRSLASSGGFMARQGQAMMGGQGGMAMGQGGMMMQGRNPRFNISDPQEAADLEKKVKDRQGINETVNEITISLKPYVNCKLTDPLADEPDQKDHTMSELPMGVHTYGGVPFDVEGIVQLNGPSLQGGTKQWPSEIKDITIGHPFKKLHLLQSAFHIDSPGDQQAFAKLILHYADGSKEELQLVDGVHALRCTSKEVPPFLPMLQEPPTELAWLGFNPYLKANNSGGSLHLYRTTLENPKPDKQVTTVDYISTMSRPAPLMVGLTVE